MTRTVPVSATQTPGNLVTSALWNAGPAASNSFLTAPPLFFGNQLTLQSVATNTFTPMALDNTVVDSDGGHSNVTNNSRYTCQVAGWYLAIGAVAWVSAAANRFDSAIAVNGNAIPGGSQFLQKPADIAAMFAIAPVQLAVGSYVEVWGRQFTGGNLNTAPNTDLRPALTVWWISK